MIGLSAIEPYIEKRPWGSFTEFVENTPCTVKIITVHPGQELSLQYHNHRDEFWFVLSGSGIATIGGTHREIKAGDHCSFSRTVTHRAKANNETLVFLEIALGDFDEHDIVHLQDDYGRTDAVK